MQVWTTKGGFIKGHVLLSSKLFKQLYYAVDSV